MSNEFLREVDEHLHAERMETLWKKHKLHILGAVGLLFVSVIGFKGYENYAENKLAQQSQTYWESVTGTELNTAALESLEADAGNGFGMLAAFRLGADEMGAGHYEKAAELFGEMQSRPMPKEFKELAKFYQASAQRFVNIPAAKANFVALSASGSTYRISALEALADIALEAGNTAEAYDYYQAIVNSPEGTVPPNALGRANAQISVLREQAEL